MLPASQKLGKLLTAIPREIAVRLVFRRVGPKPRGNPESVVTEAAAQPGGLPVGVEPRHHPNVEAAHVQNPKASPHVDTGQAAARAHSGKPLAWDDDFKFWIIQQLFRVSSPFKHLFVFE